MPIIKFLHKAKIVLIVACTIYSVIDCGQLAQQYWDSFTKRPEALGLGVASIGVGAYKLGTLLSEGISGQNWHGALMPAVLLAGSPLWINYIQSKQQEGQNSYNSCSWLPSAGSVGLTALLTAYQHNDKLRGAMLGAGVGAALSLPALFYEKWIARKDALNERVSADTERNDPPTGTVALRNPNGILVPTGSSFSRDVSWPVQQLYGAIWHRWPFTKKASINDDKVPDVSISEVTQRDSSGMPIAIKSAGGDIIDVSGINNVAKGIDDLNTRTVKDPYDTRRAILPVGNDADMKLWANYDGVYPYFDQYASVKGLTTYDIRKRPVKQWINILANNAPQIEYADPRSVALIEKAFSQLLPADSTSERYGDEENRLKILFRATSFLLSTPKLMNQTIPRGMAKDAAVFLIQNTSKEGQKFLLGDMTVQNAAAFIKLINEGKSLDDPTDQLLFLQILNIANSYYADAQKKSLDLDSLLQGYNNNSKIDSIMLEADFRMILQRFIELAKNSGVDLKVTYQGDRDDYIASVCQAITDGAQESLDLGTCEEDRQAPTDSGCQAVTVVTRKSLDTFKENIKKYIENYRYVIDEIMQEMRRRVKSIEMIKDIRIHGDISNDEVIALRPLLTVVLNDYDKEIVPPIITHVFGESFTENQEILNKLRAGNAANQAEDITEEAPLQDITEKALLVVDELKQKIERALGAPVQWGYIQKALTKLRSELTTDEFVKIEWFDILFSAVENKEKAYRKELMFKSNKTRVPDVVRRFFFDSETFRPMDSTRESEAAALDIEDLKDRIETTLDAPVEWNDVTTALTDFEHELEQQQIIYGSDAIEWLNILFSAIEKRKNMVISDTERDRIKEAIRSRREEKRVITDRSKEFMEALFPQNK